jgi:hypothetical protein
MRPGDYRSNNDLYWRKAFGFELSVKAGFHCWCKPVLRLRSGC